MERIPGIHRVRGWAEECRAGFRHLPVLRSDPEIRRRWLRHAWLTWVGVLVATILAAQALPPALDAGLRAVFPEVTVEKKILGLVPHRGKETNPLVPFLKWGLISGAWLAIAGAGALFTARRLSAAVEGEGVSAARPGAATVPNDVPAREGIGPDRRYAIDQELGRGGMGVVYRATDRVLERPVALKELPAFAATDAVLAQRFRQEAKALARLTHPNIVQVYDLVEDGSRLWMALELIEGGDVSSAIGERGRLPASEVARIGIQMAAGLGYAHGKGVIHRDVKPANVLVTADGLAKLADFGIARLIGSAGHTAPGQVYGSPHYLSPEQASGGAADERSDVYSMGAALFEMLTGEPPFVGEALAILSQHISREVPSIRGRAGDVPAGLEDVVLRMLAKRPEDRPRDMAEAARLLEPFA
jgi:serine/threonine-protein kinase